MLFPVVTLIALFASQHCSETIAVCLFGAVISWNEERIRLLDEAGQDVPEGQAG